MQQRALNQHVVLEKFELEYQLGLRHRGGVRAHAVDGEAVALGKEGELPSEAADDFAAAAEFLGAEAGGRLGMLRGTGAVVTVGGVGEGGCGLRMGLWWLGDTGSPLR